MNLGKTSAGLALVLLCLLLATIAARENDPSPPRGERGGAAYIAYTLQELVDRAEKNATLALKPGIYVGPAVIDKPLVIDGNGQAIVDGRKQGTVITIKADGVKIKNLRIINSGDRHDLIDAAIALINSAQCEITNNTIEQCLFGIKLHGSRNNLIKENRISSLPCELGLRGDGIWAWWSDYNTFIGNTIDQARDFVVWYSMGNIIERNRVMNCRYSLHFMFSDVNYVRNNHYENNAVGIYNMYSTGIVIERNTVQRSPGATGMGIGLKEASETIVKNNRILYCSRGIGVDQSPFEPDTYNYFIGNELVFNNEAVSFVTDRTRVNNVFEGNIFKWNMQDVAVSGTRGLAKGIWRQNYWDRYEGFDMNGDGIGDMPYRQYIYADQLLIDNPALQFFRGAVAATFLEFLYRLVPFSEPELALVDGEPLRSSAHYIWQDEEEVQGRLNERISKSSLIQERRGKGGAIPYPPPEMK